MPALTLSDSVEMLKKHAITVVEHIEVKTEPELKAACKKLRYPIVMKVVSEKLSHKTDKGGVRLNIDSLAKAKRALHDFRRMPGFQSAMLQKQLSGREIIIGGKFDEQFGHTILFGLGGVLVEVIKDFSIRICPITRHDAKKMIHEIKGYPILAGVRGQKPINFHELEGILLKTSEMLEKENIRELDINPLIATHEKIVAVDCRAII